MTIKYNRNISVIGGGCAGYSIVKELSKCRKNIIDFYLGSKISNNNFWGFWNFDDVNDSEMIGFNFVKITLRIRTLVFLMRI